MTLVLLVLALGAGLAVIFSGPTEFSVIRDRVQALLASGLGPDYVVEIGRSVVDVDPALGLVAEIDDVVVRDRRDSVVARVPSTRLAIDPLALLRLQVEVSTVELSSAQLSFVRSAEGEVYLGDADTVLSAVAASLRGTSPPNQSLANSAAFLIFWQRCRPSIALSNPRSARP